MLIKWGWTNTVVARQKNLETATIIFGLLNNQRSVALRVRVTLEAGFRRSRSGFVSTHACAGLNSWSVEESPVRGRFSRGTTNQRVEVTQELTHKMAEIIAELLIESVKKRPALYLKSLKEYSNINYKKILWEEVSMEVVPGWSELDASNKIRISKFFSKI